jgi:hypothetical protein
MDDDAGIRPADLSLMGDERPAEHGGGRAAAGRSCPARYGYGARVFRRTPEIVADTLYVIGGLYGNPFALDAVEAIAAQEARNGTQPQLVFNGDFHWFDTDPAVFEMITRRVLRHTALRGNVETELAGEDDGFGCGCAYPENVSDAEVERSNRIIKRLRDTARQAPQLRRKLGGLPMHALAQVGAARVAVVHGDATSLAGWDFAHDRLADPANKDALTQSLRTAQVDIFASSHTCLPVLHRLNVDNRKRAIINNGAAGMPNFAGTRFGIISRIATTPAPDGLPVLHEVTWQISGDNVYMAAVAAEYDVVAWRTRFLADWGIGSPAHESYFHRIEQGPAYSPEQAYRQPLIGEFDCC